MLKKKAIRKIMVTTTSLLIIFMIYLFPTNNIEQTQTEKTSLEIEYITGIGNNSIYLLNENNFLVKNPIILDGINTKNKIKNILEELITCDCNFLPDGLFATIPKDTKINKITIDNDTAVIDFSKEILNQKSYITDKMIESIVFSITELDEINKVKLLIDEKPLNEINNIIIEEFLTRDIGINKKYQIKDRNNINKVTIYYIDNVDNKSYYVPVTKYLNLNKEKVEVIIESLANEYIYESNLISKLNQNTSLIDYKLEGNTLILNFNEFILNKEGKIEEDIINTISYSLFDNYDIQEIIYKVNNEEILKKSTKDID